MILKKVFGYPDPDNIKNVNTSGTSAKIELADESHYIAIASEDCYFTLGETGDAATTSSMYLPANMPFAFRTGIGVYVFFHAIQKDTAGFVRIQKMIEIGQ